MKTCKIEGCNGLGKFDKKCGKYYFILGYCGKHYQQYKKHSNEPPVYDKNIKKICKIDFCNEKHCALGYCQSHYDRFKANGDALDIRAVFGEHRYKNPLYFFYHRMKSRCYSKSGASYKNYGSRGIKVCDRWNGINGFNNFLKDMGERPNGTSLDRIDNNGNYEPSNCRWATNHQQQANKRNSNNVVGVSFDKKSKQWVAQILVNKTRYLLGSYKDYEMAVSARKKAEIKFGIKI